MNKKSRHTSNHLLKVICKKTIMITMAILLCFTIIVSVENYRVNAKIVIEDDETLPGNTPITIPGSKPSNNSGSGSTSGNNSSSSTTKPNNTYNTNLQIVFTNIPETTDPAEEIFNNLCNGAISWVANRAIQELTSLLISSDIEYVGDFLVAIQSPAARAEMQHKTLVKTIYQVVLDIQNSVNNIQNQLDDLDAELKEYETAAAFERATISLRDSYQQYQTAWENYQGVVNAGMELKKLEEMYPEETRTAEQKALIEAAEASVELATTLFINVIEEGKGFSFINDIQTIPSYLWNPSNPTSTYLGAYEAFLRERYAFEHQIVDALCEAVVTSIDMQDQMLTIYKEYIKYKKNQAEEQGDYTTYAKYTNNYFSNIGYCIIQNANAMVESMGIGNYLLYDELTEDEIKAAKKINPNFVMPETIDYKATINGVTYDAYRVRDNATLSYYIILTKAFATKDLVKQYKVTQRTNNYPYLVLYRPDFTINSQYTDDGQFKMVSSVDDLAFIRNDWTNLRAAMREDYGGGLNKIASSVNRVLLYSYEWSDSIGAKDSFSSLLMNFQSVDLSQKNVESVEAKNVFDSSEYQVMVIYKDIVTNMQYEDNVLKFVDADNVSGNIIHVSGGQTLDLTAVDQDASDVTIVITGSGTVKANPNMKYKNSNVIICNTEKDYVIEISDLNVVAAKYSDAALDIKTSCTVEFTGSSSFTGTTSLQSGNANRDFYLNFTTSKPMYACHGILTNGEVTLMGGGSVKAVGESGGAGVCFKSGNLTIDNLTLEAKGSMVSYEVVTVGAGIGSSVSFTVKKHFANSIFKSDYYYIAKNMLYSYGDSTKNKAGELIMKNSNITASSKSYTRDEVEVSVEEVGGIRMTVGEGTSDDAEENHYYCLKSGEFKNCTIKTENILLSSRISTKDVNNAYNPEPIQITAFTKGSNGVTTDGVSFMLIGTKGQSDWIKADEIGNDKGESSQIVKGASVGQITSVKFKTRSGNAWWAGKITIEGLMSGNKVTLYGGRWIGENEVTLSPNDNIYELIVNTGTEDGAGTDSGIYVQLKDINKKTSSQVHLSDIHQESNAFENGDSDTFWIYVSSDFAECTQVLFYSNHKNAKADWLLESFTIKKVQGETEDNGFTYNANQWLTEDKTVCFGKYSGSTGQFYLEVKTSDKKSAGTDSNIWLTIYGDNGNTEEINIGKYAGDGNNFEKNDKDCFNIAYDSVYIGTINKIVIRKDNKGVGPGWHLDYITITEKVSEGQSGQCIKFKINQWINDDTYTFGSKYIASSTRKSSQTINRNILSSLTKHEDGSYSLDVDTNIVMNEEAFALIAESNIMFTLNMKNEIGELLYSVIFDGSKFTSHQALEFKSGYSSSNGNAIIDFLSQNQLPTGTVLKINASQLGFDSTESICVLQKDEEGWSDEVEVKTQDGVITLNLEEGKQILLKKHGNATPVDYETENDPNNNWVWITIGVVAVAAVAFVIIKQKTKKD